MWCPAAERLLSAAFQSTMGAQHAPVQVRPGYRLARCQVAWADLYRQEPERYLWSMNTSSPSKR